MEFIWDNILELLLTIALAILAYGVREIKNVRTDLTDLEHNVDTLQTRLFGDERDDTRNGFILTIDEWRADVNEWRDSVDEWRDTTERRIDGLEAHVDRKFDHLDRQQIMRHDEIAMYIGKIVDRMDDPPDDVEIREPRDHGPFDRPWRFPEFSADNPADSLPGGDDDIESEQADSSDDETEPDDTPSGGDG